MIDGEDFHRQKWTQQIYDEDKQRAKSAGKLSKTAVRLSFVIAKQNSHIEFSIFTVQKYRSRPHIQLFLLYMKYISQQAFRINCCFVLEFRIVKKRKLAALVRQLLLLLWCQCQSSGSAAYNGSSNRSVLLCS